MLFLQKKKKNNNLQASACKLFHFHLQAGWNCGSTSQPRMMLFLVIQDTSTRTEGFRQAGQDHVHEGGHQEDPPGTR